MSFKEFVYTPHESVYEAIERDPISYSGNILFETFYIDTYGQRVPILIKTHIRAKENISEQSWDVLAINPLSVKLPSQKVVQYDRFVNAIPIQGNEVFFEVLEQQSEWWTNSALKALTK